MPNIENIIMILIVSLSLMLNIALVIERIRAPKVGTLHIDETPTGSLLYSFDVEIPIDDIPKHPAIRLDVKKKGEI